MRSACTTVESRASTAYDRSVATNKQSRSSVVALAACDNSVGDESDWFSRLVEAILPREKAGLAVCTEAGLDHERNLRSCERYAAGHVKVTGWVVRALLRGESGLNWLRGYMDDCNPQWWQDVKEGLALLEAVRRVQAERQQQERAR